MTLAEHAAVHHEDLRDDYLLCRTLSHSWEPASASHMQPESNCWWFVLRCERCVTERQDLIGKGSGEVLYRKYVYPDGYQIDETVVRSQLRVEWEKRRLLKGRR